MLGLPWQYVGEAGNGFVISNENLHALLGLLRQVAGVVSKRRRAWIKGLRRGGSLPGTVRRAVHLSTESVLLDGGPLVNAEESWPLPARPVGGYSATKAQAEREALAASQARLDVVVVRPRFIWGRDDTTALPQLLKAVDSGKFAWIDGGR